MAEALVLRLPASEKAPPSKLAVAACCASLVAMELLPMDELLWPGGNSATPTSSAMAVCKDLEGAAAPSKASWSDRRACSGPRLDAALIAKVVGGDVASLRATVLNTLS